MWLRVFSFSYICYLPTPLACRGIREMLSKLVAKHELYEISVFLMIIICGSRSSGWEPLDGLLASEGNILIISALSEAAD